MSDFKDIKERALAILKAYDELNISQGRKAWSAKDHAMGFVGDVGDLMKLVAAKEGVRAGTDIDSRLGHELADCLWSILVIANHYGIDVEKEFVRTMDYLDKRIKTAKETP